MKRLCIIHANCQGEALLAQLSAHAEFGRDHHLRLFSNYVREHVPPDLLARCDLFLYQHLGPEWGELASERLLAQLGPGCRTLCIPNMFLLAPWPLWSSNQRIVYADSLLDALLARGLTRAEILRVYVHGRLERLADLDGLAESSLKYERSRELHTPVKYLDIILSAFRERPMMHTVNHPCAELQRMVADAVLAQDGYRPMSHAEMAAAGPQLAEFDLPIHPQVAERLGLKYAGPDSLYEIYGRKMDFAQYVGHYVTCRQIGVGDFIGYLRLAAKNALPEHLTVGLPG